MENRRHVYRVLSESLGSSIEHSKKFISLQYKVKLELVEKFSDYLEAGEKWMGKCESIKLQQILSEKLKK
jgi:exoribonuclease II